MSKSCCEPQCVPQTQGPLCPDLRQDGHPEQRTELRQVGAWSESRHGGEMAHPRGAPCSLTFPQSGIQKCSLLWSGRAGQPLRHPPWASRTRGKLPVLLKRNVLWSSLREKRPVVTQGQQKLCPILIKKKKLDGREIHRININPHPPALPMAKTVVSRCP